MGVDDTDSKEGMCTTYIGAVIVDKLKRANVRLVGFPRLIRLNPGCPHKTRGNCAISLTVKTQGDKISYIKKTVLETVEELAELHVEKTNPGVVFYQSEKIPAKLKAFSKKVVQDIVAIEEAEVLARELGAEVHKFKLGRGIIGALAAIGNTLDKDWTFELVAYRTRDHWGTPRKIDAESVKEMDARTSPRTFDNLDQTTGEVRITPHTPCPVLYGIRGEDPEVVVKAKGIVRALEPVERWIVYKTNQGTDEHLRRAKVKDIRPYWSVIVDGVVCRKPKTIIGGHVIFRVRDATGEIDCAAYEPTRQFRDVVRKLTVGDRVRVYGGVKKKPSLPLTINLEKMAILRLVPLLKKVNPTCPRCGKRMKSEGRGKGYSCKRCKTKAPVGSARFVEVPRDVGLGAYEVPPRARRHLAKPLLRVKPPERAY